MANANLQIINLEGGGAFEFQFFPSQVTLTDRANWERQNLTHAEKPLFYANREPREILFPELWLDTSTVQGLPSIRPQLEALAELMNEETGPNRPPLLLAVWGDWQEFCVLEELEVKEHKYNKFGAPIRVEIRLTLVRIQPQG